jgi:hypothetical protein
VEVLETKRLVVEAVPVVVEFWKVAPAPVTFPVAATFPDAETLDALMFVPVMFPALMAPPNDEVLFPVTWRLDVVAVPETMRFDEDAVPLVKSEVAYRLVAVAFCEKYAEPMTSRAASVLVAEAPIKTALVVVVRRIPDPLKVFHSCPDPPPAPASAPQANFPVEALYRRVKDSPEQSPRPSWKNPRATESWVVEAKDATVSAATEDVPL